MIFFVCFWGILKTVVVVLLENNCQYFPLVVCVFEEQWRVMLRRKNAWKTLYLHEPCWLFSPEPLFDTHHHRACTYCVCTSSHIFYTWSWYWKKYYVVWKIENTCTFNGLIQSKRYAVEIITENHPLYAGTFIYLFIFYTGCPLCHIPLFISLGQSIVDLLGFWMTSSGNFTI